MRIEKKIQEFPNSENSKKNLGVSKFSKKKKLSYENSTKKLNKTTYFEWVNNF